MPIGERAVCGHLLLNGGDDRLNGSTYAWVGSADGSEHACFRSIPVGVQLHERVEGRLLLRCTADTELGLYEHVCPLAERTVAIDERVVEIWKSADGGRRSDPTTSSSRVSS